MKAYDSGFSLLEILVALAILGVVLVGALGVIGGTSVGGLLEAFPTGFITGRTAKDITVAGSYLQALHEFIAANSLGMSAGLFCLKGTGTCVIPSDLAQRCPGNSGGPWSLTENLPVAEAPTPQSQPYQLQWETLYVLVENWYWDGESKYSATAAQTTDKLIRVCSVLNWELKDVSRVLAVDRFIK